MLRALCTLGPIGYLPAPGTMASAISIILVVLLKYFCSPSWYATITILSSISAYLCVKSVKSSFLSNDPSHIVIDEVVGMLVTFLYIPLTPTNLVIGFTLFRFFDISKFWPIYLIEFPSAFGIVLDDVVAGGISALILMALQLR